MECAFYSKFDHFMGMDTPQREALKPESFCCLFQKMTFPIEESLLY